MRNSLVLIPWVRLERVWPFFSEGGHTAPSFTIHNTNYPWTRTSGRNCAKTSKTSWLIASKIIRDAAMETDPSDWQGVIIHEIYSPSNHDHTHLS